MANQTVKINGQEYPLSELNDTAKMLMRNIEITDQKIASLKQELGLFQVARETFGNALVANLPKVEEISMPAQE